jgi:hypothetical protein
MRRGIKVREGTKISFDLISGKEAANENLLLLFTECMKKRGWEIFW